MQTPKTLPQLRRELEDLKEAFAAKQARTDEPTTDTEIARSIAFTFAQAAAGRLTGKKLSQARFIHFTLFGTPEIDPKVWGSRNYTPIVTISQECNKLAPVIEADAIRWGY